jgi:hypothetical protein
MINLEESLLKLKAYVAYENCRNEKISKVNVSWHIEHSLLVLSKIIETANLSNPERFKSGFNLSRVLIFALKKFPRGKGKAPEIVKPKQTEPVDFEKLFKNTLEDLETLKALQPNSYYAHPVLGQLNKKNIFKLLDIHTNHHIGIIKDIISSK